MKKIFIYLILSIITLGLNAQTATDFTSTSCSGINYNLFSKLDSGKVVVIGWAMPCGGCVVPLQTTYTVVQSYQDSLPGMVSMLLCDDLANTPCNSLDLWASSNGLNSILSFSDPVINMADYGEPAMPKVVVTVGNKHQVFFMADYEVDGKLLKRAIDSAITMITGIYTVNEGHFSFQISPNPANGIANISFRISTSEEIIIDVLDDKGTNVKTIFSGTVTSGLQNIEFSTATLRSGIYFVRMQSETGIVTKKISVLH